MNRVPVAVKGIDDVPTSFYVAGDTSSTQGPLVLFFHGGDSTCLEWSGVVRRLHEKTGLACVAVDWWTGGWTERAPLTAAVNAGEAPWAAIRNHLHSFWRQELGGRPIYLVGTSMGGAVAIDFANTYPEAVSKLVLVDAGGESYAAPPPDVSAFLAPFCPTVLRTLAAGFNLAAKLPVDWAESAHLQSLHRNAPGWIDAYVAYLGSGGYPRVIGPDQIRTVSQKTLVIWGDEDPVLDPADAAAFERDLPNCAGVRMVAGCGHSPHVDDPAAVSEHLADFLSAG